ncbi:putative polysaccharide biosynthesis protein [Tumebacillus lipolyticus]|uniref:Oligosaccharide flippase family protein n=1 Tax=Tumebacillus lipolyticus TaxID=1280370 RepID=A0ABW4ZTR9_9BACL
MSAKKGLAAGALSLAAAGLISKILGVVYIVPFQNMAKDYAMGLYQNAYAIYVVMLTLATAGIPLAISKLVAERSALRDFAGADQLYRVGARFLAVAGVVVFVLLMLLGGTIGVMMGDYNSSTAIRALAFALLIVPLLAAMRGYIQGHQSMAISGNSQVVEQLVRVTVILVGVYISVSLNAEPRTVAAVATFSSVLGALASLFYLGRHVVKQRRENRKKYIRPSTVPNKVVLRKILKISIPISLSSIVLPLSQMMDSFTITNLLMFGFDWTKEVATSEFGVYTARALRLIALPLSLAVAVGLSLMPAISEAIAQKNIKLRNDRVITAFRLTSLFAFPTAVGLYVLAGPIDIALFTDLKGADTIAAISWMAIFSSYELVCCYILQAMGFMYLPIRNMFAGLGLKLVLLLLLVPKFGILGAGIAAVIGYILSSGLNFAAVRRLAEIPMSYRSLIIKPLFASLVMGGVVWTITKIPLDVIIPWPRVENLIVLILAGSVGAAVFGALMILQKGVSKDELRRLPGVKRFVR